MITLKQYQELKDGSQVIIRPDFGGAAPITVTVTNTCIHKGQPTIDYNTGGEYGLRWAYIHQIDKVVSV